MAMNHPLVDSTDERAGTLRPRRDEAVRVLKIEAESLVAAAERLDERFERCVEAVLACTGKIITLGAGTSGMIARKIAATFTSTGTPALFLHPGDALHGSLGVVDADDLAIMVSNSGETDELTTILPYLRNRGVQVITLTGNLESTLARGSLAVLDASAEREACPLDLAPTSTTTVALGLGDALAMAVMAAKGITRSGFARNHPSGRLGRRLLLTVRDLMHADDENPVLGPDAGLLEVVGLLGGDALGGVSVIDADRRLLGVVTDGDLRRALARTEAGDLESLTARDLMTADPITAPVDGSAYDALRTMEDRPSQISVLPVVDPEGRSVGLLRLHDLVRAGL